MADKKNDTNASDEQTDSTSPEDISNDPGVAARDAEADIVPPEDASEQTDATAKTDDDALEATMDDVVESATQEPAPHSIPAAVAAPAAPKPRSIWPMIIAGLLLVGLGFLVAREDLVDPYLPESLRSPDLRGEIESSMDAKLEARLTEEVEALRGEIAALQAQVDAIPTVPDISPLSTAIDDVAGRVDSLADLPDRVDALEDLPDRVVALEDRPLILPSDDAVDYSAAFNELQEQARAQAAEIKTLLAEAEETRAGAAEQYSNQTQQIETLLQEAEEARAAVAAAEAAAAEAARTTLARAALAKLQAALDVGEPFDTALAEFAETGFADIPEALDAVATDGVAPLGTLQVSVTAAARDALEAARTAEGPASGAAGFLERQLGIRSLEPREGDGADAVLSRLVAHMEKGNLQDALVEAQSLPAPAAEAMADWLSQAESRAAALGAATTLSDSLPTN